LRCIIHIGLRKTGTSTIQRCFADHTKALIKGGILYPFTGRLGQKRGDGHYAHHDLAWSIRHLRGRTQYWNSLWEEVKTASPDSVVISAETFSDLTPEGIIWLHDEVKIHDVQIVMVIRSKWDFIISEYTQQAKKGRTCDTLERFAQINTALFDFENIYQRWVSVFGSSRVKLLEYDCLVHNGLLESFLSEINISSFSQFSKTPAFVNQSPNESLAEALIRLNRLERKLGLPFSLWSISRNSMVKKRVWGQTIFRIMRPWLSGTLYTDSEKQAVLDIIHSQKPISQQDANT